jgi:hypothetical protein
MVFVKSLLYETPIRLTAFRFKRQRGCVMSVMARRVILSVAVSFGLLAVLLLLPGVALAAESNAPVVEAPSVETYSPLAPTNQTCMGLTDAAMVLPQFSYDFSADAWGSIPTTFPAGTFSGNAIAVRAIGAGWGTWNPQVAGKHVLFVNDHTIAFTTPKQAVGAVAEPNNFGWYDVTIEAFDVSGKSLGSFTRSINGAGGAAFIGLASPKWNIASVKLTAAPGAEGFAYSDLIGGASLLTFLAPLRPQDSKVFSNAWKLAANLPIRFTLGNVVWLHTRAGLQGGTPAPTVEVLDSLDTTCFEATCAFKMPQGYFQAVIPRGVLCNMSSGEYTVVVRVEGLVYEVPIRIGALLPLM